MADQSMNFNLYGTDKSASKAFDKVGKSAEDSSKRASKSFADIGKALAAVGVVKFASDSVKAFTEAQEATQRLEDAFGKFPKLGDSSAASIEKITGALQKKTRFDDDATNAAAGLLAQFDLTGKQIEQVLPLLQDYAVATGKDIQTAAQDLGKTFLGQTRALKEVGINYKSTGDQAQDFANITELLGEKVGGFAENQGKTAAGQMEILKNQFGDVQEAIGQALLPALKSAAEFALPVVEAAGKLVTWFGELPGPVKAAAAGFAGFLALQKAGVFAKLTAEIGKFRSGASTLGSTFASIGKGLAVGGAVTLVTSLVDAMGSAGRKAAALRSEIDGVVSSLGGMDTSSLDFQKQFIEAARGSESYKSLADAGVSAADAMDYLTGKLSAQQVQQKYANLGWEQQIKLVNGLGQGQEYATGKIKADIEFNQKDTAARLAAANATGAQTLSLNAMGDANTRAHEAAKKEAEATEQAATAAHDHAVAENARAVQTDSVARSLDAAKAALDRAQAAATPYEEQVSNAADASDHMASATKSVVTELDILSGRFPTAEQAASDMHKATDDLADSFGLGTDKLKTLEAGMVNADGSIKTITDTGRDFRDGTLQSRDAIVAAAQATYDSTVKTDGHKAALAAAQKVAEKGVSDWHTSAAAIEGSGAAADKTAKAYGLIPSEITSTIRTNAAEEKAKVDAVARAGRELDGAAWRASISVDAGNAFGVLQQVRDAAATAAAALGRAGTGGLAGTTAAHATGGAIYGPGTGTSDSIPAMLSDGEHVFTASDVSKAGGQGAMYRLRSMIQKGALHFAGGGGVSAAALAGRSAAAMGNRQSVSVGALGDLGAWIKDLAASASQLRAASTAAAKADIDAKNARWQAIDAQKAENAERLRGAKAGAERAKVERQNAAELAKVTKEQDKKVAATKRERDAASRAAAAADRHADAEARVWQASTRARTVLSRLGAQYDQWSGKLSAAQDKLTGLRDSKNQLAGSISGFGGGILGFSDQRTTAASVIAGQKYNASKIQGFGTNLSKLKSLGLNSSYLSQIAGGGEDGMKIAAALAGGSRSQIAEVNKYAGVINGASSRAAGTVYDGPIKSATTAVAHASAMVGAAAARMNRIADILERGVDLKWNGQVMAKAVRDGEKQLARR